ncbi:hypothetical protein PAAG_07499 [Paracoccidioides lutzii Pb01]|uniref:Uncharacterized protein n=1 Tax=Paracoccidioides lutzii (strain ATCC MYA-826 / Pb01) TaxID=502779 RepID=C1H9Q8_PARBA|nr:hypothetical protein PAAG_07499 [Paracoccidioides lutzii Pb01]EEH37081.1 hypothetical protein PAAG_07499 [Paracoccidioides lutzii Pb01]
MPRPPARRGRRPKAAKCPGAAAPRGSAQLAESDNVLVVIPKPNKAQVQALEGQDNGCTERSCDGARKENWCELTSAQRQETVVHEVNEEESGLRGGLGLGHQTPMAKQLNDTKGVPTANGLESSVCARALLSNPRNRGDASSRVQKMGTPAFESSMLSNFRRRPRQPSILQMMQGDPSSELDDDDCFLGSFDPVDESTPLKSPSRKNIRQDRLSTSSSTPRDLTARSLNKKRKADADIQVQVSRSPEPSELVVIRTQESAEDSASEDDMLPTPRGAQPPDPPEILSQTMVPPESSPALPTDRQPLHGEYLENASPSPVPKPDVRVSTAALREKFLPHRRLRHTHREANDNDGSNSDDGENDNYFSDYSGALEADQDELSYSTSRASRKRKNVRGAKKGTRNNKFGGPDVRVSQQGPRKRKPPAKSANNPTSRKSQPPHSKGGHGITYSLSRHVALEQDKENQLANTTSSPPAASERALAATANALPPLSEELRLQARKFAEISKWRLDFEDATPISSGSSLYR